MDKSAHREIEIFEDITKEEFITSVYPKRKPAVLRGINIGPCIHKWTPNYLGQLYADKEVKIHVSTESKMDFTEKNFLYRSLPFGKLIERASQLTHKEYFLSESEMYYLRSLGNDPRKEKADIKVQFPILADDIIIPDFFPSEQFFSSVFRISSGGLTLWTHYDIMDNLLIQIKGTKKAVLFPPTDVPYLYIKGDKSRVLDVDNPDTDQFPEFTKATQYRCILQEGDILFIPALWFHNMTSLEFSIAVNVFWKHLDDSLYDKKDPYGNKDLLPAANAMILLSKSMKSLELLPEEYKKFYVLRMITQIQETLLCNDSNK